MKIAKVTRPANGQGDKFITLTATIKKGTDTLTKEFKAKVIQLGLSNTQCVQSDKANLTIVGADKIITDLVLPTSGDNGTNITWKSGTAATITNSGIVTRPANGTDPVTVIMTATISKGTGIDTITEDKPITVKVLPWTDQEEVDIAVNAISWETIKGSNISQTSVTSNLNLSTTGERSTTIAWISTNAVAIKADGTVTQPTFTAGDVVVSLTATVTKGTKGATATKQIVGIKVLRKSQTNMEAVTLALNSLVESTLLGNQTNTSVTVDLTLPKAPDVNVNVPSVGFTWSAVVHNSTTPTTNISIVDNVTNFLAKITRPDMSEANIMVDLIAKATSSTAADGESNSATLTRIFTITIPKLS